METQIDLLGALKREYGSEYDKLPLHPTPGRFHLDNGMFGSVDAEVLYAMVRRVKPDFVLEIGGGWSSLLIREALDRNDEDTNGTSSLVVVDPGTPGFVYDHGRIHVDQRPLQMAPERFNPIKPGHMVVADTSHVFVKGHEIDMLLRAMKDWRGVYVHFHDIFLPESYPEVWRPRAYDEQDHLAEFLDENPEWQSILSLNEIHITTPAALEGAIASYDANRSIGPGSYWLYRQAPAKRHVYKANRAPMGSDKQVCIDCDLSMEAGNHTKPKAKKGMKTDESGEG
jgi:hypothetical protein